MASCLLLHDVSKQMHACNRKGCWIPCCVWTWLKWSDFVRAPGYASSLYCSLWQVSPIWQAWHCLAAIMRMRELSYSSRNHSSRCHKPRKRNGWRPEICEKRRIKISEHQRGTTPWNFKVPVRTVFCNSNNYDAPKEHHDAALPGIGSFGILNSALGRLSASWSWRLSFAGDLDDSLDFLDYVACYRTATAEGSEGALVQKCSILMTVLLFFGLKWPYCGNIVKSGR